MYKMTIYFAVAKQCVSKNYYHLIHEVIMLCLRWQIIIPLFLLFTLKKIKKVTKTIVQIKAITRTKRWWGKSGNHDVVPMPQCSSDIKSLYKLAKETNLWFPLPYTEFGVYKQNYLLNCWLWMDRIVWVKDNFVYYW